MAEKVEAFRIRNGTKVWFPGWFVQFGFVVDQSGPTVYVSHPDGSIYVIDRARISRGSRGMEIGSR